MKLWQKQYVLNDQIEKFTIGRDRELDLALAPYDVLGSLAHIQMLAKVGLLTKEEHPILKEALQDIYQDIDQQQFRIDKGVEDVHSQVELLLIQRLGETGKKIHSGRSRNDQVLVDLRLWMRANISELVLLISSLIDTLLDKSEANKNHLMPGYTHLQIGMVSSAGLWFGAFAESLTDDLQLLQSVYHILNQNPLGSAAGYGSSFPLDREMTTDLLGFEDLNYNALHAQLGRGKSELFLAFAMSALGATIGKMAMDICLYNSQNYQFFKLPNEFTTGSSIMPHKKNPDVVELIRARCNQLQNLPAAITMLTTNLPAGYHRDFQLLKEIIFPAMQQCKEVIHLSDFLLQHLEVQADLLQDQRYDNLFSVDAINQLVVQGLPFREAYQQIGKTIEAGDFIRPEGLSHSHAGSIDNLCNKQIRQKAERVIDGFQMDKWKSKLKQLME